MKVYAAGLSGTPISTDTLLNNILNNIIDPLLLLLVALAVIYFMWGAFQFVRNADSPDERQKGAMNMLWGVVGLFIMFSAWGILNLVLGTIGK